MASHRSISASLIANCLALALLASACSTGSEAGRPASALGDRAITVASFNFPESELLAELYGQALREAGFAVDLQLGIGPRELVDPALAKGLVELVPEYAGTAVEFLGLGAIRSSSDVEDNYDALVRVLKGSDLVPLDAAPAQNTNVFAVTRETAQDLELETLSDLGSRANEMTLGGPPECPTRPLCLLGLERSYRLHFADFVPLDAGGPFSLQALLDGTVDVALRFSTDPRVDQELLALEDDRALQPAENVTPIVHREVLRRWGDEPVRVVDAVSAELDTDKLRDLNAQLEDEDASPAAVATQWLEAEGLV
jgi:osmoprotectant transport system substrate-binding protein